MMAGVIFARVLLLVACYWIKTHSAEVVTHTFSFNVAHMTGAPDGFLRQMIGEELA